MTALIDRVERWCKSHGISTTSDWQIRCTRCGHCRNLKDTGAIRIGAAGVKFTLAECHRCNAMTRACIERKPCTATYEH